MGSTPGLIAVDVGSTRCKVAIVSPAGGVLAYAADEVPYACPAPDWVEIDPECWWELVCSLLRRAVARAGRRERWHPVAMAVTGLMHAPVLVDAQGRSLAPAQLWMDRRCREEAQMLAEACARVCASHGMRTPGTTTAAAKVLWLARHRPDVLRRARWVLMPKDFIRFRLTGEAATDPSDAAGTGMYAHASGRWVESIVHACGARLEWMPPILPAVSLAGRLRQDAAEQTGLPAGLPVAVGSSDTRATLLGSGAGRSESTCIYAGTAAWVAAVTPATAAEQQDPLFPGFRVRFCGATGTSGGAFSWLVRLFAGAKPPGSGDRVDYAALEAMASLAPPGSDGLLFFPHLVGTRAPVHDPRARGAWIGLTLAHGMPHLVRSCLEGVAFSIRRIVDASGEVAGNAACILAGGMVKSRLWCRILASVLNRSLRTPTFPDAGLIGAAAMAAVAAGLAPDGPSAATKLVQFGSVIAPDPEWADVYPQTYRRYMALDDTVRHLTGASLQAGLIDDARSETVQEGGSLSFQ